MVITTVLTCSSISLLWAGLILPLQNGLFSVTHYKCNGNNTPMYQMAHDAKPERQVDTGSLGRCDFVIAHQYCGVKGNMSAIWRYFTIGG